MGFNKYKTLHRSDAEFNSYLWGSGLHQIQGTIPLPLETLNLGAADETVTFEIIKKDQISKPSIIKFISSLIKLPNYILILMPFFYILVKAYTSNQSFDAFTGSLSGIAMLFLFAGLNIRNDVSDHISGYDRVNLSNRKRPIAQGWITAYRSSQISWLLILLAAFISIPIFILHKELFRLGAIVILLFVFGQFVKKNSYKSNRFGETILFILVGPALACGYQISLGALVDNQILVFGSFWGLAVLFLVHMNNFSHLLTSSQSKIQNTMTKMGFDRAQFFLVVWWLLCCVMWFIFHLTYAEKITSFLVTLILVVCSIPFVIKILKLKSPVGSDLIRIRKDSYKIFLLMVTLFFIENFWALGEKLNWML